MVTPPTSDFSGLSLFANWPMMSVHFWGEPVTTGGSSKWKLLVRNSGDRPADLKRWSLTFYGTEEDPQPGVEIVSNEPVKPEVYVAEPEVTKPEPEVNNPEVIPDEVSEVTEDTTQREETEEDEEESLTIAR